MIRSFASPQLYIQGPGAFDTQLGQLRRLGNQALVVTDQYVYDLVGKSLISNLTVVGIHGCPFFIDSQRETFAEQMRAGTLTAWVADLLGVSGDKEKEFGKLFVIGLGGGGALDVAKTLARALQVNVAVLPTSAATDAATSRISVIYDEAGVFQRYDYYETNPAIVLVDSQVIFAAPVKMLAQGIADGLATYVEARAVWEDGSSNTVGTRPTLTALGIAEKCRAVLFADSQQALKDREAGRLTTAFEAVVEANILLSGLGFENGGLSLAHAFHNVLQGNPDLQVPRTHGEVVAVGLLLQLAAEKRGTEFEEYYSLLKALDLPVSLQALGLTLEPNQVKELVAGILATKKAGNHLPAKMTAADLLAAFKKLN